MQRICSDFSLHFTIGKPEKTEKAEKLLIFTHKIFKFLSHSFSGCFSSQSSGYLLPCHLFKKLISNDSLHSCRNSIQPCFYITFESLCILQSLFQDQLLRSSCPWILQYGVGNARNFEALRSKREVVHGPLHSIDHHRLPWFLRSCRDCSSVSFTASQASMYCLSISLSIATASLSLCYMSDHGTAPDKIHHRFWHLIAAFLRCSFCSLCVQEKPGNGSNELGHSPPSL